MSFRARLTTFFVLIVVIPMAAMGTLVFALIDSSSTSKADARSAGVSSTAAAVYTSESRAASVDAEDVAKELALIPAGQLRGKANALLRSSGLARITVQIGTGSTVSVGDPTAIAPGIAVVRAAAGRPTRTITVAELTATQLAQELAGAGTVVVVGQGTTTLGTSLAAIHMAGLPSRRGTYRDGSIKYRTVTQTFPGFNATRVSITVLSDVAATGALTGDRILAAAFILGFLILAFFFTLLASRGLQSQVSRFLDAARRLGNGDFSAAVQTVGHDEFAELGAEFNAMSQQLQVRLDQLELERRRFRDSVRRIGEAFASGLNRDALLALALRTAVDATEADRGRVIARIDPDDPLAEAQYFGSLAGLEGPLERVERQALVLGVAEVTAGDAYLAAAALGATGDGARPHGVITVCRQRRPFSADAVELLRSLASRATLALDNVERHDDVARQAITDDLTGLATHGHFQELLDAELRSVARYGHPVAVAMFDLDNFKRVNDTYGHLQGDVVLQRVAEVLRETCRDADVAARYGGEELALILPHTDIDGAFDLAERARVAIERMSILRLDNGGWLRITTSVGVAASSDGRKELLVRAADTALYAAKRSGKNRTIRADGPPTPTGDAAGVATSAASTPDE